MMRQPCCSTPRKPLGLLKGMAWPVISVVFMSACTVGPDFSRPEPPAESRYTNDPMTRTVTAEGQAQHFLSGSEVPHDWWRLFKSEPLNATVRQSISHNLTLQAA